MLVQRDAVEAAIGISQFDLHGVDFFRPGKNSENSMDVRNLFLILR